jgi:hypothetical protein
MTDEKSTHDIINSVIKSVEPQQIPIGQTLSDANIEGFAKDADDVWLFVKRLNKDKDFTKFSEQKKIEIIATKYKSFQLEYPIVLRYMILCNKYHRNAFIKYLKKIRNTPIPPDNERDKNFMREQWIMRQADYVTYLFTHTTSQHYSSKDIHEIWKDTHKKLTDEFAAFETDHKKITDRVTGRRATAQIETKKELIQRIAEQGKDMSPEQIQKLYLYFENRGGGLGAPQNKNIL